MLILPSRRAAPLWAGALALACAAGACGGESAGPPDSPAAPDAPPRSAVPGASEVSGRLHQGPGAPPAVVLLEPHAPLDVPLPAAPAEMDQYGRNFVPRLLLARAGQAVRFINSENELHNVHVIDAAGETLLNVGMPILGGTFDHVFERPGDYRVRCNVHQEMAATVRVTASPFSAIADREGRFVVSGVPYGAYDLVVRRGAERSARVVEIDRPRVDLGSAIE